MASITATTDLLSDHYLVTITLNSDSLLPPEVFVYTNNGTSQLGDYYGTCSLEDLARLKIFNGTIVPVFGNRFVRYGQAKIRVNLPDDPNAVISTVAAALKNLNTAYNLNRTSTKIVTL